MALLARHLWWRRMRHVRFLHGQPAHFSTFSSLFLAILTLSFATTQATSTFPHIEQEFNIGIEVAILSLSLFVLGTGIGPLLFGGLSEFLGRNIIYRCSFIVFVLFNLPVAFANNIG